MLDFELLWKVITLLTYMTHRGTFVLFGDWECSGSEEVGIMKILQTDRRHKLSSRTARLRLWQSWAKILTAHIKVQSHDFPSGFHFRNKIISCEHKCIISKYKSKCRFKMDWSHIAIQQSGVNHFVITVKEQKMYEKRMEIQTVGIFVHSTFLSPRWNLLEIGRKSYRVIGP